MSPSSHYDLIILGTGSGNSIVSPAFDDWRIAIVEEGVFGGTCLNRGCIPTKMLVHAADVAETVRQAGRLGVDAHIDGVRWRDIRDRVFGRIDPIAAGGDDYRANRCPNITVYRGRGRFVGPKELEVSGADGSTTHIGAERIVLATGARPVVPDIEGLHDVAFHTSDTIMRIDDLPSHLVVVGGGYIATELAHVFGAFGSRVTIVHRGPVLLRGQDHEVSERLTALVADRQGFDLRLNTTPVRVRQREGIVAVELSDGSTLACDSLLIATGRRPNSDTVDAAAAGIALHPDGRVMVDETQATSVPGVWALGDVSSAHQLKHVANREARTVQHNLLVDRSAVGSLRRTDHRFVPAAVFTSPQIASVGLTENAARAAGHDVVTKVQSYGDVAYGWAMEDTTGFCKLVADRTTRRLLGAHLIGPHAASLIHPIVQGLVLDTTVEDLARTPFFIHPALPEVLENALLGLLDAFDEPPTTA